MKRSPFAIISVVAAIMLFIPMVLIVVIDGLGLGEAHPLVVVAFPLIFLLTFVEAPIHMLNVPINFPVVLPMTSIIAALVSLLLKEPAKRMALGGLALTILSILLLLLL